MYGDKHGNMDGIFPLETEFTESVDTHFRDHEELKAACPEKDGYGSD
jgi:hypothetical protein